MELRGSYALAFEILRCKFTNVFSILQDIVKFFYLLGITENFHYLCRISIFDT